MNKLVSIIVANYNKEKYLENTLNSILNQTYSEIELIIVDDNSSDNSVHIIKKYVELDPRVFFYQKPTKSIKGPSSSRNFGYLKSKGSLIFFFDSDDELVPNAVEEKISLLESKNFDWIITSIKINKFDESQIDRVFNTDIPKYEDIFIDFLRNNMTIHTSGPFYRKYVLDSIFQHSNNNIFNTEISNGEDIELAYRVVLQGFEFEIFDNQHTLHNLFETSLCSNLYLESESIKFRKSNLYKLIMIDLLIKSSFFKKKYIPNLKSITFKIITKSIYFRDILMLGFSLKIFLKLYFR